ncbi:flavodoxin FldB [Psychromonas sp. Urea-02u-13]|uniref:flavodoxin FldB n=1 Tax=Psychromonas sp. Urea-02u-13 TaxID=2058326 RepID=UPI000C32F5CE|nr:flavodoxin FldB [Psychromonas sp. Urea-02u-13]PKG39250.1 flavodoxin FldB [Psychromonas sp. Urea-02u-13]
MKIGLFYGSSTCYTEIVAEKIQACIGEELVELFNIKEEGLSKVNDYDILILGISTWDFGELQEDWGKLWDEVAELSVTGKIVALFGLGDQDGYGEWFVDAIGMLHDEIQPQSPRFIGQWPIEGYQFTDSKALTPDKKHFLGLAIDEDTQYELSDERIDQWCLQILEEIQAQL